MPTASVDFKHTHRKLRSVKAKASSATAFSVCRSTNNDVRDAAWRLAPMHGCVRMAEASPVQVVYGWLGAGGGAELDWRVSASGADRAARAKQGYSCADRQHSNMAPVSN
jgi:hypothetical protein